MDGAVRDHPQSRRQSPLGGTALDIIPAALQRWPASASLAHRRAGIEP